MPKKEPLRMCIGCSKSLPKSQLIRIVKTPQGEINIDFTGKVNGRGAYICRNAECLKRAIKSKRLASVFQTEISEDIYVSLEKELLNGQ